MSLDKTALIQNNNTNAIPVCISGMHRSGTSMITRLLNLSGLYLGDADKIISPKQDNSSQGGKTIDFMLLSDRILARLGGGWDFPPPLSNNEWLLEPNIQSLLNEAKKIIKPLIKQDKIWGWEDPRNSLIFPFWQSLLPNLKSVICLRNPLEVAYSLQKKNGSSIMFGLNLWLNYNRQLLKYVEPDNRIITHYDIFFLHPEKELRRIADWLGLAVDNQTITKACQSIDTQLKANRPPLSQLNSLGNTDDILEFYQELCQQSGEVYQSMTAQSSTGDLSTYFFTGERAMPLASNMPDNIMQEHWSRYRLVVPMVAGKKVLDVACGAGYGSNLLAETAQFVTGGDISSESIAYCQLHYQRDNQKFEVVDVRDIPYPDKSFDIIVSFETIEHIVEGEQFLQEITRLLTDDGKLIISTPLGGPVGNPHHVAYYQKGTFGAFLHNFFDEVQILYQRNDQFFGNSLSPEYAHTFTGEYILAVCKKPIIRVAGLTSIIILTYNQLKHTRLCLESIERNTTAAYEIIIVDNGSRIDTLDYLKQYQDSHKHVKIVFNPNNKGFPAGNNQGLAIAKGEFVLLLNNDTVVTTGWLTTMLSIFHKYPEVGLVGPMSNYVAGQQLVKDARYSDMKQMRRFAKQWIKKHKGESTEFFRLIGFCLLVRRAVVDRVGGLDEQYGQGNFEDDDFCIRAAIAGFKARIAHDVFVHHTGNQTFKELNVDYKQSIEKNWKLFKAKWRIPADISLGTAYSISLSVKDPSKYYVPLISKNEQTPADTTNLDNPQKDNPQLAEIELAQSAGDWSLAVKLINNALETELPDAEKAQLYNRLGYSYVMQSQLNLAERAFIEGLKLVSNDIDLLSNVADVYLQQEQFDKGTEYLNRALAVNPNDINVLLSLGNCSIQLGAIDTALMAFQQVKKLAPETEGIDDVMAQLQTISANNSEITEGQ